MVEFWSHFGFKGCSSSPIFWWLPVFSQCTQHPFCHPNHLQPLSAYCGAKHAEKHHICGCPFISFIYPGRSRLWTNARHLMGVPKIAISIYISWQAGTSGNSSQNSQRNMEVLMETGGFSTTGTSHSPAPSACHASWRQMVIYQIGKFLDELFQLFLITFGWTFPTLHDILLTFFAWLVIYLPLWRIWKSVGMILPNIWKKTMFQTTNQVTIPHARNRALHISFWCPLWLQARTRFRAFQMTGSGMLMLSVLKHSGPNFGAIFERIKGHRWKGWCQEYLWLDAALLTNSNELLDAADCPALRNFQSQNGIWNITCRRNFQRLPVRWYWGKTMKLGWSPFLEQRNGTIAVAVTVPRFHATAFENDTGSILYCVVLDIHLTLMVHQISNANTTFPVEKTTIPTSLELKEA